MKLLPNRAIHVGTFACVLAATLSGCMAPSVAGVPASQPSASVPADQNAVRLVGLLTLKGPELGAWWALTDASGVVWRLDTANPEQFEQLRSWQNRRVEVEGVPNGMYLSTSRLKVSKAQLKPN